MPLIDRMIDLFHTQFPGHAAPRLFSAPGRVNLIGDHTDYNDGFVLPAAIDRHIHLVAAQRSDGCVNVYAQNFNQWDRFTIEKEIPRISDENHWGNYLRAMVWSLLANGYTPGGMDAIIGGDIPMGAGLSSSAAMEVVIGFALLTFMEVEFSRSRLALMAQQAENEFVGMRCGIMDQFIACLGQVDCALLIDCRDLSHQVVPLPSDAAVVIVDSGVHRGLVEGKYNARRKECERAAAFFKVPNLRDVDLAKYHAQVNDLPQTERLRARHVITENQRTLDAAKAFKAAALAQAGELMKASHDSLRDDFQVSCRELDHLVEIAMSTKGVYGARITGGGFGGCMVALVEHPSTALLLKNIKDQYHFSSGRQARGYICQPSAGVSEIGPGTF